MRPRGRRSQSDERRAVVPGCDLRIGQRRRAKVRDMAMQNGGRPKFGSAPTVSASDELRYAISAARKASSSDQLVADADQSASDADQVSSDIDQTAADRDQSGADRDQQASDQD